MPTKVKGTTGVDKIEAGAVITNPSFSGNATVTGSMTVGGVNVFSGPYRNLIINGDMQMAQRGTSTAGITSSGYYTCDRWYMLNDTTGTWAQTQDTDVPTGQGFANSLKLACTTADASLAASDGLAVQTRFEGQNLQQLKKGTANAESVTLSFWVKSNKTGTYIYELYDQDNARQVSKSYTISSADTWEKKTITISGDTTGAFDNDNGLSLYSTFWLAAGSNKSSGTLNTSWAASVTANRVVGQLNLADSTSNYINITGVQLEVGEGASDFEFLPYDVQLARCYRYYQVLDGTGSNYAFYSTGAYINGTTCRGVLPIDNIFRAFPTATFNGSFRVISDADRGVSTIVMMATSGTRPALGFSATTSTGTGGNAGYLSANADGATSIEFDAEL